MADIDKELRKIVEDSVRHARANVGFTLNNHEAAEQNISMNVETIMVAVQKSNLALLSRIKEEIPEYWPNCENYPDSMGTHCNKCRWCKNRNRDDLVTGYEWANDDLKVKLDNIAKEIRGEGHE